MICLDSDLITGEVYAFHKHRVFVLYPFSAIPDQGAEQFGGHVI